MSFSKVRLEREGDVAVLTLDDPATRNALSWAMADEIAEALDQLENARALVLTGAGKGFCSGGDLMMGGKEALNLGEIVEKGLSESVNPMLTKLARLEIPVVSAINGAAAGAGAPLALSADFVLAGESAFFYFAFPNVGFALDAGASWLMPRLVGPARAMEALMLAERIPAAKALEWGMIHKVVPDEALMESAMALAARLASGPTVAYGQIRQAVRAAQASTYEEALGREAEAQRISCSADDCGNAVRAFLAKQQPVFEGR